MRNPSSLDVRAAKAFVELGRVSEWFDVECRFDRLLPDHSTAIISKKLRLEFERWFGNGPEYFAGALEYVRLATSWYYGYKHLKVKVRQMNKRRKISGGTALKPLGEIILDWRNGEFTLTVLHELVHLFKPMESEDWVETRAFRLLIGL